MQYLPTGLLYFSASQPSHTQSTLSPSQPHNPYSCLAALQALDKNIQKTNATRLNRLVVRQDPTQEPQQPREELVWKQSRLIWSKGTTIYRKFDYSDSASNQNHIIQALFAYFDQPGTSQNFNQEPWSDNRALRPSSASSSPVRALCVLLLDVLKIYFPTGEEYKIAIPFPITKLWPIERGVLAIKKPLSSQCAPFIPEFHPPSPRRTAGTFSKKSGSGDPLIDSMITENDSRWWSTQAGFQVQEENHDVSVADTDQEEAQLRKYWAERNEIESSMLWTLSDPCTYYFQPVLTSEKVLLKSPSSKDLFSKATTPLMPLICPPRKAGSSLSSGTVVFVADPILEPLFPICVTASTEGFSVFVIGRLPFNISEGIIHPSSKPDLLAPAPPPPRSPTPPTVEPRLRRSPRKLPGTRRNLTGIDREDQKANEASPSHTRPPTRLASLSLRRSISNAHPRNSVVPVPPGGGSKKRTSGTGGRRVSNASNSSFTFGGASSTTGLRRASSGRKSFVEQQLELMSVGPNIESATGVGGPNTGFEDWFAGVGDDQAGGGEGERGDGLLADETLDPEWVIERILTVEVAGRLSPEDLPTIHATIYDSRGSTAYLSLCIPRRSYTYTFRLTRLKDSIKLHSIGNGVPEPGVAIGPVLSTRPKIFDLFRVNCKGIIEILSADSICVQKLPCWSNDGFVSPTDGSVIELYLNGEPLPYESRDLRVWPLDDLVLTILEALAEGIGTRIFAGWLSRFVVIQSSEADKPIDALGSMLLEVFTGEPQGPKTKADRADGINHLNQFLNSDPVLKGLGSRRLYTKPTQTVSTKPIKPISSPKKKSGRAPGKSSHLTFNNMIKTQAMISLAKVCAELTCSVSRSNELKQLILLMTKLSDCLGWLDWTERLRRMTGGQQYPDCVVSVKVTGGGPPEPLMPDLIDHLERMRVGVRSPFEEIFRLSNDDERNAETLNFYGIEETCPRSKQISSLYRLLFTPGESSSLEVSKSVLLKMDQFEWTRDDLDDVPWTLSLPLREALRDCQLGSIVGLSKSAYDLIDRPDLAVVAIMSKKDFGRKSKKSGRDLQKSFHIDTDPSPTIRQLCVAASAIEKPKLPITESETINLMDNQSNTNVASRFSDDMRIVEVAKMLNYTKEVVMALKETSVELSPADLARQFSNVFASVSKRTLALPFGGSCFWYRTDPNIAAAVPSIKLDIKVLPMGVIIQPDPSKLETQTWPRFHAGVAAALSLSAIPGAFDNSQISLDRPAEPDERHAGYLLGLGLNGHLRSISRLQIYRYLENKHEMTSTGLLLGLSATFLGTGDARASSIIAAHVPALHPTKSIELQVSPLTQSAGFVSFGLLHLGTGNRRLSEGMLRELARTRRVLTDTPEACRETYTLCAGLGYGLVMLGRGTESSTSAHKDLMRTFKSLIHGDGTHPLRGLNSPTSSIDVSVTSPAATLALALLYLKTGREEAVTMCEIPQTGTRLEYIRPDLLLIRTLAKCLIRWESIESDMNWVETLVPKVIMESVRKTGKTLGRMKSEVEMIYWSIVTGAALGMALKHAGAASAEVHSILLKLYDRLLKAANSPALSVQGKLRRHCLRSCHNVITLALGIVMAGTGELEVLRRLRIGHSNIHESTNFGSHLATHFALGLLFLGGGRFTLSTSNRAIACLVCSLYPIFPSAADDQIHHLQALRHLWVLAVEPRCVVGRDIDRQGELIFLPLKLKLRELTNAQRPAELRAKLLTAPTLVPELSTIRSLIVESPRYWPLILDLEGNEVHRNHFVSSQTLWVKRKVGHLSYSQDPKGTKSIASRGKGAEEVAACAIDDLGRRSRLIRAAMKTPGEGERGEISGDLNSLIKGFDLDEQSVGLVDYICARPGTMTNSETGVDFSAFVASALLQCLVQDKLELVPIYLELFSFSLGRRGGREMTNLVRFYRENTGEFKGEMKRLVDGHVLEQIERLRKRRLEIWGMSKRGIEALETYLDSDGMKWAKNEDGEWLAEWVDVHSVPLPGTLKKLRKMVEEELKRERQVHVVEVSLRGWLKRGVFEDQFIKLFVSSVRKGLMG